MRKILISDFGWSSTETNPEIQAFMLDYKPVIDILESNREYIKVIRNFEKELQYEDDPLVKAEMWKSEQIIKALREEGEFNNKLESAINQLKTECQEKFGITLDIYDGICPKIVEVEGRVLVMTDSDIGAEYVLEEKDANWL